MQNYLTQFATEAEYNEFIVSNDCPYINTSYIQETDEVMYLKDEIDTYQAQPFTVHIDRLSNGESVPLVFFAQRDPTLSGVQGCCRYKINNNSWQTLAFTIDSDPFRGDDNIRLYEGDTVQIICKTNNFDGLFANREKYDLQCSISGNVMSLFFGDDFVYASANKLPLPQIPYNGSGDKIDHIHIFNLIDGAQFLIDASDLWLPTRNLPEKIFREMFKDCVNLTAGPDIKAKYLPDGACNDMFLGCSLLTDMPLILAETVEAGALDGMFNGCSSLVNTTQLHVKKIYGGFGNWMFNGCSSLVTAPVWDEDVELIDMTYNYNWFDWIFGDCSSLEDLSTWNIRFNNISAYNPILFHAALGGCTSLTNTPYFGLTYAASDDVYLDTMFEQTGNGYPPVDTIYFLFTTGQIDGPAERFGSLAQTGTIYLKTGSRYLPGGDLYGQLPCNLPSGWTVAEYVDPNTSN